MLRIAAVTSDAVGAFERAQHDLDGELAAILAPPVSSIPVPICCASASSADRRSSAISRSAKPSGNDVLDLLPEQLVAAVAELLLGLHVQQHDLAVLVHDHHRVRGRLQQPAVSALHLRQELLRLLAHG